MNPFDTLAENVAARAPHPAMVITARAILYVALIVACMLFAPEDPQIFLYTEF